MEDTYGLYKKNLNKKLKLRPYEKMLLLLNVEIKNVVASNLGLKSNFKVF